MKATKTDRAALERLVKQLNDHAVKHAPNRIRIAKLFGKKPWVDPRVN